jgi:hypothetical protein
VSAFEEEQRGFTTGANSKHILGIQPPSFDSAEVLDSCRDEAEIVP